MTNLLARLNTRASLDNATPDEKKYGAGIYIDLCDESEKYRIGTFKKVIDSILEQATSSEEPAYRNIAADTQKYMAEQSPVKISEIMIYDPKTDQYARNVNDERSKAMSLGDCIKDYIVKKQMAHGDETTEIDYLDMVVDLKSPIGGT